MSRPPYDWNAWHPGATPLAHDADELRDAMEKELLHYRPVRPALTVYRRYGRPGSEALAPERVEHKGLEGSPSILWAEQVRRDCSNHGHPFGTRLEARCDQRHPLLWLVRSRWGLVPITSTRGELDASAVADVGPSQDGVRTQRTTAPVLRPGRLLQRFHTEDVEPGRPRTIDVWEQARPMPPASCLCYAEAPMTVAQVRGWLRIGERKVTYRRIASSV